MTDFIEQIATQVVHGARTSVERRNVTKGQLGPYELSKRVLGGMSPAEWNAALLKRVEALSPELKWERLPEGEAVARSGAGFSFLFEVR